MAKPRIEISGAFRNTMPEPQIGEPESQVGKVLYLHGTPSRWWIAEGLSTHEGAWRNQ